MPMSGSSGMEDHHLLASDNLCQTSRMKNLTATICLTIAVLLGSVGVFWSAGFQKDLTAYQRGESPRRVTAPSP